MIYIEPTLLELFEHVRGVRFLSGPVWRDKVHRTLYRCSDAAVITSWQSAETWDCKVRGPQDMIHTGSAAARAQTSPWSLRVVLAIDAGILCLVFYLTAGVNVRVYFAVSGSVAYLNCLLFWARAYSVATHSIAISGFSVQICAIGYQ